MGIIKLTESQYRLLLENSRKWKYYDNYKEYRRLNDEDTYRYLMFPQKTTGLSVQIWIDDEAAYIMDNHPLWIYFKNGNNGNLEPMSVSRNPQIINDELYFVINDNDDKSKNLIRKMSKNNNFEFDNPYAVKYKYKLSKEQIEDYIEYVKLIKFFVDIAKSYDFNIEIKHKQNL